MGLFGHIQSTKRDERLTPRLVDGHAGADVVVDVRLQMRVELGGEVRAQRVATEQTPQPQQCCANRSHRHSVRKATMGSTRVARHAGRTLAISAATPRVALTATNVGTSGGRVPVISVSSSRAPARPPPMPTTNPAATMTRLSLSTSHTTSAVLAPSAMRTPISGFRLPTRYD